MEFNLRAALLGRDRMRSLEGVTVAAGLYGVVMILSFVPELLPVPGLGALVEPGGVLAGMVLAAGWAFRNSGLGVSVVLVLAPVLARLTYHSWVYAGGRSMPVALPLSFGGHGAWAMWVPLAVLLGMAAFGVGVLSRLGHRSVGTGPRPGA